MEASKSDERTPVRTKPWAFGPISTEEIGDLEKEYVLRVLSKKRLFRYGGSQEHSEAYALEQLYKERTKVKHGLGVNAGTSALISALIGAGVGPGDEVIIPAYTYIATATAVLIARAVPVIVEVDDSLTMDPQAFEAAITPHTKAVIPVHMRGVPCKMDEILSIARKANLIVIEDVAQANGGSYKGRAL
ncbi:MAG: putative aminotransferase, partial [Paenibacillus sp.]|nr:putative aminotransferase [Paenibacillus sp.]